MLLRLKPQNSSVNSLQVNCWTKFFFKNLKKKRHKAEYGAVFSVQAMTLFCKQSFKLLMASITWTATFSFHTRCFMGPFVLENVHSVALVLLYLGRGESNTQAITFSWFQLLQGLYSPENTQPHNQVFHKHPSVNTLFHNETIWLLAESLTDKDGQKYERRCRNFFY